VAKARPIPGLSEDDLYAVAAARIVAVRSREVADHAAGVLDVSDIERVHDMRVATRRLRAALEVFEPCFPHKRFRAALREVKELADALGERRDRDVTIAGLEEFAAAMGQADRAGISSLTDRLRDEQAEANEALVPYVSEERMAALSERLSELVADAARDLDGVGELMPVASPAGRQTTNGAGDGRPTTGAEEAK
jgi:CHAD domain-containing protein